MSVPVGSPTVTRTSRQKTRVPAKARGPCPCPYPRPPSNSAPLPPHPTQLSPSSVEPTVRAVGAPWRIGRVGSQLSDVGLDPGYPWPPVQRTSSQTGLDTRLSPLHRDTRTRPFGASLGRQRIVRARASPGWRVSVQFPEVQAQYRQYFLNKPLIPIMEWSLHSSLSSPSQPVSSPLVMCTTSGVSASTLPRPSPNSSSPLRTGGLRRVPLTLGPWAWMRAWVTLMCSHWLKSLGLRVVGLDLSQEPNQNLHFRPFQWKEVPLRPPPREAQVQIVRVPRALRPSSVGGTMGTDGPSLTLSTEATPRAMLKMISYNPQRVVFAMVLGKRRNQPQPNSAHPMPAQRVEIVWGRWAVRRVVVGANQESVMFNHSLPKTPRYVWVLTVGQRQTQLSSTSRSSIKNLPNAETSWRIWSYVSHAILRQN
jgi:hypothetical protein